MQSYPKGVIVSVLVQRVRTTPGVLLLRIGLLLLHSSATLWHSLAACSSAGAAVPIL
jgi:hypothetical protein